MSEPNPARVEATHGKKPHLEAAKKVEEEINLDGLWQDSGEDDCLTETTRLSIPVGKPKDFFRLHPDPTYRRRLEVYRHKPENSYDDQYFIMDENMVGKLEEAKPYILAVCMYRDGTPRIWPLRVPADGEQDNDTWKSARDAARQSLTRWVKLRWEGRAFVTRDALPGYAPDPSWNKLPTYKEMLLKAFGSKGFIRDETHTVYANVVGAAPSGGDGDDGDL